MQHGEGNELHSSSPAFLSCFSFGFLPGFVVLSVITWVGQIKVCIKGSERGFVDSPDSLDELAAKFYAG